MQVKAKGHTPADGRLLLVTAMDKCYETEVEIALGNGNTGGLLLYYNEKAYAGVTSDGKKCTIYRGEEKPLSVDNQLGSKFRVRILNQGNRLKMSVSADGKAWNVLAENVDVSHLNHNVYKGFYALRPALFAAGKGKVGFRDFRYRNAIPQEKDMGAYLMVFHRDETHGLYMAVSRDGYTFTAVNNGEPVLAGDTIAYQRGIRDPHIFRTS